MIWLDIAGGVALTLFGIRFLRKGLERLFGGGLNAWLASMTAHPLKAFAAGVGVGAVAPSSTGLSLLCMQLLKTGNLPAERVLAVLLGAGVGITITVQLIAFHLADAAPLLIVAGVACFQFCQREKLRGVGQCVLALGFVFLAMQLIGRGAEGLSAAPETRQISALLEGHVWLVAIAVTGLAVLLQSSTAAIGLGIGLVAGGVLSPALIVPWILGTNLGLAVTSLAAGWSTPEGRKLGSANLLVKASVAALLLALPALAERLFAILPGDELRRIAHFHTGFNLLVGLAALPFLGPITRFTTVLFGGPAPDAAPARPATHLDERALDTPSLALVHATRETMRMADEVQAMLQNYWRAESSTEPALIRTVQRQDDQIDTHHREIRDYLTHIRESAGAADTRWSFTLFGFTNDLESVGDIIDKNLCDALLKRLAEQTVLTPEDRDTLDQLYRRTDARISDVISLLTTRDPAQARALLAAKDELGDWCRRQQAAHYQRLRQGGAETLASSTYFLDVLNSLKRINSHITSLAYAFIPGHQPASATPRKAKR